MIFRTQLFLVLALLSGCGGSESGEADTTCLANADASYNTCEADYAGDTDWVDACEDTWCDELVLCGASDMAEDCAN